MVLRTEFQMPGAYHFDAAAPAAGQPLSATVFRPPMSPSASSSVVNLAKSTGSFYSDISMTTTAGAGAKRKRTRDEVSRASTPNRDWNTMTDGQGDARHTTTPLFRQHQQEGQTGSGADEIRYTLAGQIETPTGAPLMAEDGILAESTYSDINYRKELGPQRQLDDLESPSVQFSGLVLETPAQAPVTPRQMGWSTLALTTIGGVVGKVWEFCKAGGFRGFQAGGGERYGLNGETTPSNGGGRPWCNEHDVPTLDADEASETLSSVPGGFPQTTSEYVSLHELITPDSTPRPAVKRRQTSTTNGDDLHRNWIMVDQQSSPSAPALAPSDHGPKTANMRAPRSSAATFTSSKSRKPSGRPGMTRSNPHQSRYSTPTNASARRISVAVSRLGTGASNATPASSRPRASVRISHAGSPALTSHSRASYAAPRSPSALSQHNHPATFSPSRIPLPTNPVSGSSPSKPINPFAIAGTTSSSRPASPAPFLAGHKRTASSASARLKSARSSGGVEDSSPRLSAEAKQLAARKLAAERDADAKMEAFNRRLEDMIRQGKEALGSTVEVDMDFGAPTAGWEDDD